MAVCMVVEGRWAGQGFHGIVEGGVSWRGGGWISLGAIRRLAFPDLAAFLRGVGGWLGEGGWLGVGGWLGGGGGLRWGWLGNY